MAANTSLTGDAVKDGYVQLVHISDTLGNTGTATQLYDGNGTAIPMYVSTAGVNLTQGYTLLTDDATLTAAQSGGVIAIATDAKTITLPATVAGLRYTIVNTGADDNNIV